TTTYSWTNNTPSIGLAASGTGNISAFTAVNSGIAPIVATITVTPTFNNGSVNCTGPTKNFTITVNPTAQVNQPTNQVFCNGSSSTLPAFATANTVGTTTYSWTNDTPSIGLLASGNGNIPVFTATNAGSSPILATIVVTPTFTNGGTSCTGSSKTFTIKIDASTIGGAVNLTHTKDLAGNFNLLPTPTNNYTDCHDSSGILMLSGQTGTILRWESSINAGSTWTNLGNGGNTTYTYAPIVTNTIFRAVIQNANCSIVNSATTVLFIIPNIKPSPISATPSTICEGDSSVLFSSASFSSSQNLLGGGLFNTAQPEGWYVDGGNFNASGDNGKNHTWLETNGNAGTEYDTTSNDKFAIVRGAIDSRLETPVFDLIGLTSANLTYDYAYQLTAGAWGKVELSFDGGATYPVTLITYTGNQNPLNKFNTPMSINLNAYLGYSNLRIKFNFHGTVESDQNAFGGSSWAVDNVKIPQAPIPNITSDWENLNTHAIISVSNTTNVTVFPAVTTTYAVTSYLNGCRSYGPDGTTYITVTVNKRPTANIGIDQLICYGGTATFTIALTGKAPWIVTYTNGATSTTVTTSTNPYVFSINNVTANATYTVTNLSDANCNVALPGGLTGSATVTVLLGTPGVWTGLVSTDWFDCKNWEQGLPSLTIDAQIPSVPNNNGNPKRMPVIDRTSPFAAVYSGIASARDLIVNPLASVTMVSTNNSELQISRNWRNSGAFIPGTGTVTFNGYTLNQVQTINASIKTNETFYNLTTNNTNGAKGISLVNNFDLTVLNFVTLTSGDIRLTGEAQLVQAGTNANPGTGTGKLLKDQQGQRNSFNYNYWSSPVSTGSNSSYSISNVLRDGTDVTTNPFNPIAITFGDGVSFADGALSIPINISNRWIWSYNSLTPDANTEWDDYFQWNYIGSTGLIKTGEGYTMKGTGGTAAITTTQNYVFVGKPNSGNIILSIAPQGTYLLGNPYASALDAKEFIKDNLKDCGGCRGSGNAFNGALYFWDHFGLSNNHYLAEYQGAYATYTLIGGAPGIADSSLTASGSGTKVPGQYIPVAQGFFVDASLEPTLNGTTLATINGGNITFKNSQRAFIREGSASSVFMKRSGVPKGTTDTKPKIRLGFDSSIGAHRQLLVGADPNTTKLFDIGYDAQMFDTNDNDMFWEISDNQFVIQGVPDFNVNQVLPIGIVVADEGEVTIKIDELENVSSNTNIYLHDTLTGIYHNLKSGDFKIALSTGEYNKRFSLRFESQTKTLDVVDNDSNDGIVVLYSNNYKTLIIRNNILDSTVNTVSLYNMIGQAINKWDVEDIEQTNIQIPIKNMPSGIYIVKVNTSKGESGKKIIIK
ncbi:T9SS type A sorting domain-containing protein, partial [Flavobacterium sp.]|uniref:T9SS type A sorting domain-containing protein n=1 Tax=Flavobacterium sp. TaxID=239 RepID=UPI0037523267